MKKLSIFLAWVAMLAGLIYWSTIIEGTVIAGTVNKGTVVKVPSSPNGTHHYYTFSYTDAKTGKTKYVENRYLDYHEEGMFNKGIFIRPNGGQIAGLVLSWMGFVAFSICYLIAIFCGLEETRNGKYKCTDRCPLNGFCNYMHYKGDDDDDDEDNSSGSLWNSFWGIGNQITPTAG